MQVSMKRETAGLHECTAWFIVTTLSALFTVLLRVGGLSCAGAGMTGSTVTVEGCMDAQHCFLWVI